MTLLWMILGGIVVGLIVGLLKPDEDMSLNLEVATFKCSGAISMVQITDSYFCAQLSNYALGEKKSVMAKSIGELQYNISMQFKSWARRELGDKFAEYNKGWDYVPCVLYYNDAPIKESKFYKITTKEMRSKKNPIAKIERVENGPPLYGYSDYVYRKKI